MKLKTKTAAYITIAASVTFLVLLTILHFLKPEIDPSWRLISEYQIGDYGWLMSVAFFTLAVGQVSFFFAIRPFAKGLSGRIALALILLSIAGFIIVGLFPPDPITTPRELYSFSMKMHSYAGLPALLGMPLITLFMSWSLLRKSKQWASVFARSWLLALTIIAWASLIAWNVGSSAQNIAPGVPPEQYEWIGWPNRVFILAYCLWLIVAAQGAITQKSKKNR